MPHDFRELLLCDCECDCAHHELHKWIKARDLKTLFELNKGHITGDIFLHPAHACPLWNETDKISKGILDMNEYGLFTFQGQPRTAATKTKHGQILSPLGDFPGYEKNDIDPAEVCRTCAHGWNCREDFVEIRQTAYVQFCLPIEEGMTATSEQVQEFICKLLKDEDLHVLISLPKDVEVPNDSTPMCWTTASLESSEYVPKYDLNLYHHYTSNHATTSCCHEVRIASERCLLRHKEWRPASGPWSEVNDYHLIRRRMPRWFFDSPIPPVVVGVHMINRDDRRNLEKLVCGVSQQCAFPRCFPKAGSKPT